MARGWESKSVEAQIEQSNLESPLSDDHVSQEDRLLLMRKNDLVLSRRRIEQQLKSSTSDRYSDFLRRSLAALEAQIAALS